MKKNLTNYFNTFDLSIYKKVIDGRIDKKKDLVCNENGVYYFNTPISFDIETSSFYQNGEKKAIMYIWQLGINGAVFFGRSWQEFVTLLNNISNYLELNENKRIIIYVHNLGYEFQFMRKWFEWSKVFAIDERKPVYCITNNGVEFRCSYILSGYSLEMLSKNLQKYKVNKMVGDLDYKVLRTPKTTLTDVELKYCENDVRVVMAYIQEQIEIYGNITKLQLTKTGYVRKFCRDMCFFEKGKTHKRNNFKYLKYRLLMKNLILLPKEYEQLKRAFQGGFTHSNAFYNNMIMSNVHSFDFTSSYPAVMIMEKFPMSRGEVVKVKSVEEFERYLKLCCCLFDCEFTDIERSIDFESYISSSRCWNKEEVYEDNGRVVTAKKIRITLTEQDFFIIKKTYTWSGLKINNFRIYKKTYLPTDFVKAILELYQKKTTLKDVEGSEVEYLLSKEMINSAYGMCVTDIVRDEQVYDGEWSKNLSDLKKSIDSYNKSKKRFLSYPWGIWVTAYARRNLWSGILELKDDYIYSDTDSVKFLNYENHKEYFEKYNKKVDLKLQKACKHHKINFELCKPKTIKGVEKKLGVWDDEGQYQYFKTLGAKRYMTYKNDKLSLTVSGVNKKTAIPYLLHIYNNDVIKVFNNFTDGLKIPSHSDFIECPSGKQTHTYIDEEISGTVRDCQNNFYDYYEKTFIHLENAEYSLSLSDKYLDFIKDIQSFEK